MSSNKSDEPRAGSQAASPHGQKNNAGPESDTEQRILNAARQVFMLNGFSGARMQAIADQAGINKAMLHYYYRSKQKLFDAVFTEALGKILHVVFTIIDADAPLDVKIPRFYNEYISILQQHPHMPAFVINEVNQNANWLPEMFKKHGVRKPQKILEQFAGIYQQAELQCPRPEHLLVNMLSLALFPFVAAPLIKRVLGLDDAGFADFLEERKTHLPAFFQQAINTK